MSIDSGDHRRRARDIWRHFPRALSYVKPHKLLATGSVVVTALGALAGLLAPWPLAILVDSVLGDHPVPSIVQPLVGDWSKQALLVAVVMAGLAIALFQHGFGVLGEYLNTRLDLGMVLEFRSELFQHAQGLPLAMHDRWRTGNFVNTINYLAHSLGSIVLAVPPVAQSLITLLGMFVIAFGIHEQLALLAASVAPFVYLSVTHYGRDIAPQVRVVQGMEGQSLSIVHEAMSMIRVILGFGRERHEFGRFRRQAEDAVRARVKLTIRQNTFNFGIAMMTAVGTALVLGYGALAVLRGELTVGVLLVLLSYVDNIYAPLTEITSTMGSVQEDLVRFELAGALLKHDVGIKEDPQAVELDECSGHVVYEGVSFVHEGRRHTLRDISFEARPGQTVAVIGPTGAGKSTLVSLLLRFYDPDQGSIRLDGTDIRKLTVRSLRRHMSVVLQEPLLFSGTVEENIRYGRLEASMEEVVEAATASNAHEFISGLPQKYRTVLGERGAILSIGERQRITIARAFVKRAPLLILDEPTSSVDSKTEDVILEALHRLMEGRTTFMIAHRLSTVRHADLILVLHQGRLVETGSHDALMDRRGLYRQMYEAQTQPAELLRAAAPTDGWQTITARAKELLSDDHGIRSEAERILHAMDTTKVREWTRRTMLQGGEEDVVLATRVSQLLDLGDPIAERA
jgi:ATP-binding cassette subfamily B protein